MTSETDAPPTPVKTPVSSTSKPASVNGDAAAAGSPTGTGSAKEDNDAASQVSARSVGSAHGSVKSGEEGEERDIGSRASRASTATGDVELNNDVEALKKELDKITVESPTVKV